MQTTTEPTTDTPRTYAESLRVKDGVTFCSETVSASFARSLERELIAAQAELARLKAFDLAGYLKERTRSLNETLTRLPNNECAMCRTDEIHALEIALAKNPQSKPE